MEAQLMHKNDKRELKEVQSNVVGNKAQKEKTQKVFVENGKRVVYMPNEKG